MVERVAPSRISSSASESVAAPIVMLVVKVGAVLKTDSPVPVSSLNAASKPAEFERSVSNAAEDKPSRRSASRVEPEPSLVSSQIVFQSVHGGSPTSAL